MIITSETTIISPSQCRSARALLGLDQAALAERSGITAQTIGAFENETSAPLEKTVRKLARALEQAGAEFLPDDGVKRRSNSITVLEGEDANFQLLDDVYHTLREEGGEVLIAGLKEVDETKSAARDHLLKHLERLQEAGVTERILVESGDTNFLAPRHWYRWIESKYFGASPFQLYGSKLAMIVWGPPQQIVIVENQLIADTFRNMFNQSWDNARIPEGPA